MREHARYCVRHYGADRQQPVDFAYVAGHRSFPLLGNPQGRQRPLDDEHLSFGLDLPDVGRDAAGERGETRPRGIRDKTRGAEGRDDRGLRYGAVFRNPNALCHVLRSHVLAAAGGGQGW